MFFRMTSVLGEDWILQINNTEGSLQLNMACSAASLVCFLSIWTERELWRGGGGGVLMSFCEFLWLMIFINTNLPCSWIVYYLGIDSTMGKERNRMQSTSFLFFEIDFFIILSYVCVHGRVRACVRSASREQKRVWILWNWGYRCLRSICYGGWELNSRLLQEQQMLVTISPAPKPSPSHSPDSKE